MSEIQIRRGGREDVESIVRMLADDQVGSARESAVDLDPYLKAFEDIDADPNQLLMVAVDRRCGRRHLAAHGHPRPSPSRRAARAG